MGHKGEILLIDDNQFTLHICYYVLRDYQCYAIPCSKSAIVSYLKTYQRPRVVLISLDIKHGLEYGIMIKHRYPDISVIALSIKEISREVLMTYRFTTLLKKPIDVALLRSTIKEIIQDTLM